MNSFSGHMLAVVASDLDLQIAGVVQDRSACLDVDARTAVDLDRNAAYHDVVEVPFETVLADEIDLHPSQPVVVASMQGQ